MDGGRKTNSHMTNKNESDKQQNPEVTEPTWQEENNNNGETMPG